MVVLLMYPEFYLKLKPSWEKNKFVLRPKNEILVRASPIVFDGVHWAKNTNLPEISTALYMQISKNMAVKILLAWKHQVT